MQRLIALAVYRRKVTACAALLFVCLAWVATSQLKIEAFPDVTNVQVMVIALVPGQAAEDVERQVTLPLERSLVGLPHALMQRSITSFGLAQVILTFDDSAEILAARQQVQERLVAAELPEGIVATLGPNVTPVGQIYQYTLESKNLDAQQRRSWQEWVVAKHLAQVPGVADVVSFGGLQKEYHVVADMDLLLAHRVSLEDLGAALKAANAATSGGYIRQGEAEFVVRGRGYLSDISSIENTLVTQRDSTPVLVRHLAQVVQGATPRRGTVGRGDALDTVEGIVLLRQGENPRQVLAAVHDAVVRINRDILPQGVAIIPFYDRTRLVDTTLHTVATNMAEGALLVTVVIWLFLRSYLASFAVAIVMPLALLSAFFGLWCVGVPANLLSMGAIDFGILLDGAVILVENIHRKLAMRRVRPSQVPQVVIEATREVVRPTLFSMCIIVAAMLPIAMLQRVEGRIFRPMALTYAFALAGALVATLLFVPALCASLFSWRPQSPQEPAFMQWLEYRYRGALDWILHAPLRSRGLALFLLMAAVALVPSLGSEFLPQMNEGDLHVTVTLPSTVSLEHGQHILRDIRQDVLAFDEVEDAITEQGHPEDGSDDEAPNQAKMIVVLKPDKAWPPGSTLPDLLVAMRARLQARPGIAYNFSQPIKDRVEEAISGVRGQVVVKLFGDDLQLMHATMAAVRRVIDNVVGATDVEIYRAGSAQHVIADIDREAAARFGLRTDDIDAVIQAAYGGTVVTTVLEGERQVGVRVRSRQPVQGDWACVSRLPMPMATGGYVPLGHVAKVHLDQGRTQINREQLSRFLALKCNISGRDMGSFVDEAQAKVLAEVSLPPGYHLSWGGEFDNQRRAMRQLSIIFPLSLTVIFLLLYVAFDAFLPAVVVLLGLPFAAVGGVFALALTHTTLSVSAAIGFITLLGVATMDGVLVVSYMRQVDGQASAQTLLDAVILRLRPVLMTALLASLGLLPAAMSHAIGSDTQRPFAVVIIGGLISATAMTLLLLPSLYTLVMSLEVRWSKWRKSSSW